MPKVCLISMPYLIEDNHINLCRYRKEVNVIRRTAYFRALNMSLFYISSKLIIFLTFVVYVLTGNALSAEKVQKICLTFTRVAQGLINYYASRFSWQSVYSTIFGWLCKNKLSYLFNDQFNWKSNSFCTYSFYLLGPFSSLVPLQQQLKLLFLLNALRYAKFMA